MRKISVVVPVYGAPDSLFKLYERLLNEMLLHSWNYEIILVNDACPKNSWAVISELCTRDQKVVGINLSRNFGQHYALSAGLSMASGDIAVIMDCDLQDRPEDIVKLVEAIDSGKDIAFGKSEVRGENSPINRITSKAFYKVFGYLTGNDDFSFNVSFVAMTSKVVKSVNQMGESQRLFLGLLQYIGYDYCFVSVKHDVRSEGNSSYNILKRLSLAFRGITNSSTKLLRLGMVIGVFSSGFSFLYGFYLILSKLIWGTTVAGWTSSIVSTFFVGGVVMVLIGILGVYLEVVFWEVKRRPAYFIKESKNLGDSSVKQ